MTAGEPGASSAVGRDKPQGLAAEAERVVDGASLDGIVLRIVGGVGVWLSVGEALRAGLVEAERHHEDIDFVCRSQHRGRLDQAMARLGYRANKRFNALHGNIRHIYERNDVKVDIFFDRMDMCHTVDFASSLVRDSKVATPTDLLLHKLQIVEINRKDLLDAAALLAQFSHREDGISAERVDSILSSDWGFWYTATTNLRRLIDNVPEWPGWVEEVKATVAQRAEDLLVHLHASPKSTRWKMRARIGTRMRWYQVVEDV